MNTRAEFDQSTGAVIGRLPQTRPDDPFNTELVRHVHPLDWVNPTPSGRYNLVVIGAGTAGLVAAAVAAGLGAKVALVERDLMGGDCLNVGCVPSKAILSAARVARTVRRAGEFGVDVPKGMHVNFAAVMQRMRQLRSEISPNDSAARFRELGVDVYLGNGRFVARDSIEVAGQTLQFKKAVIATGARASAPPVPGLDRVQYLTNETLFSVTDLPPRLGIIGAGPIGCEMAQAFANFGSEVHLIEAAHGILPREDRDAAEIVQRSLEQDGVRLRCCGRHLEVSPADDAPGTIHLAVDSHGTLYEQDVDQLLVAAGRAPNVDDLGLEIAGVDYDRKTGVVVDDHLRTTNPKIFAAGDICSPFKFTHAADFMARLVVQNALFMGRGKSSRLVIPWSTYTAPEIAHVGLSAEEGEQQGVATDTFVQSLTGVDRAILEGETEGFVKVQVKRGTDRILGATIVAANAGDLISEITLAMTGRLGLKQIGSTIHPYPTQADAVRKLGDQFNRTRFTPTIQTLSRKWLAWSR